MEVVNSRKKKTLLPFFRIAISITDAYNNVGWLKLDPPDYWRVDKTAYCEHSHNNSCPTSFFTKYVDLKHNGISFCNNPLRCRSACIGSTVYCVGGDRDIDADVIAIYSERIGPPITYNRHHFNFPVPRNNLSHKIGSLDFFNPRREEVDWKLDNAPTLFSPRYLPQIVAVGEKIYMFGGNRLPVNELDYVPFAEVFDPATNQCFPICDPPFPCRIGQAHLFLATLLGRNDEQKILVMARDIYLDPPPLGADAAAIYDIPTNTWEPFYDRMQLLHNTYDIIGTPVPVAHQDSIYWLKGRYVKSPALIASYNWKTKHYWEGAIFGLQHESPFHYINDSPKILLHLHQDLFCLVWDDLVSTSTSDDDDDDDHTHIHFTLLRVCRENRSASLSAFVLGCFSHILPLSCYVREAYLLR